MGWICQNEPERYSGAAILTKQSQQAKTPGRQQVMCEAEFTQNKSRPEQLMRQHAFG
jgi:hypothetical protein